MNKSSMACKAARMLCDHHDANGAVNRAFFALVHAKRSGLAVDDSLFSKAASLTRIANEGCDSVSMDEAEKIVAMVEVVVRCGFARPVPPLSDDQFRNFRENMSNLYKPK